MSTAGSPPGAYHHVGAWTGNALLVWSGRTTIAQTCDFDPSDETPLGGIWSAVTGTWSPIAQTSQTPGPRMMASAVWSGNELLVFGGCRYYEAGQAGGARYDPSTESWAAMNTVGAPSARAQHSAVWTGDRMIVWGGHTGNNNVPLADGAVYDPAADSWTPMAVTGAPAARHQHTALWTGTEMIIWGGQTSWHPSSARGDGGIYDPAANAGSGAWRAVSLVGAPTAAAGHSAVWTGQQMIIWGGGGRNTGGLYDPGTDTWSATSTVGAPAGRSSHAAVWTGSRMLVFGGCCGAAMGGAYLFDPANPETTRWSTLVDAASALARYGTLAFWANGYAVYYGGAGAADNALLPNGGLVVAP